MFAFPTWVQGTKLMFSYLCSKYFPNRAVPIPAFSAWCSWTPRSANPFLRRPLLLDSIEEALVAILEIPESALGGAGPSSQELPAERHRGFLSPAPTYSFSHTQRQRPRKPAQNTNTAFQMCQESQAIPLSLRGQLETAAIQGTEGQGS